MWWYYMYSVRYFCYVTGYKGLSRIMRGTGILRYSAWQEVRSAKRNWTWSMVIEDMVASKVTISERRKAPRTNAEAGSKENEKVRRQWKPLPTLIYGKGATTVPGTVKLLHQRRRKRSVGIKNSCIGSALQAHMHPPLHKLAMAMMPIQVTG